MMSKEAREVTKKDIMPLESHEIDKKSWSFQKEIELAEPL